MFLLSPSGAGPGGRLFPARRRDRLPGLLGRAGRRGQKDLGRGSDSDAADEVTVGMLRNRVDQSPNSKGFIFDGFPRTIPQAEALDALLTERGTSISGLVALHVTDEEIIDRILLRGKTSGRADDNDTAIIKNRIEVYRGETEPVYNYFGTRQITDCLWSGIN